MKKTTMKKTALLLVDIQNDYFEGGLWPVAGMDAAARNAAILLAAAREAGQPVIHIQHAMPSADAPFFKPGTEGEKINARVAPKGDEAVVVKTRPSSFVGTDLDRILTDAGIRDLVICGAMSQMCIDSTTRDAADRGYAVTVAEDACGAKDVMFKGETVAAAQVHKVVMGALAAGFATVVPTSEAVQAF